MAAPPCCSTCSAAILKSTDRRRLSSVCQVLQTFKELILDRYSVEELTHFGFDDPKSYLQDVFWQVGEPSSHKN